MGAAAAWSTWLVVVAAVAVACIARLGFGRERLVERAGGWLGEGGNVAMCLCRVGLGWTRRVLYRMRGLFGRLHIQSKSKVEMGARGHIRASRSFCDAPLGRAPIHSETIKQALSVWVGALNMSVHQYPHMAHAYDARILIRKCTFQNGTIPTVIVEAV
jgi:hypothetical protein